MYDTHFAVNLRAVGERISVIEVQGGLMAAAEAALMNAFAQAGESGSQIILLGFHELSYMNSSGIGLLVRVVIRAQRQAQRVMAFGLQDHYRRIFELTRLQEVIDIYPTEAEALAATAAKASLD